ncbi:MAG: tripartite tricarboxylate transporter permease [Promethearchaeota archaeon]
MISFDLLLTCLAVGVVGAVLATIVSLVPGLHIYSILGFVVLAVLEPGAFEVLSNPLVFSALTVSMLVGYCLGSCISSTYFQTPDDSSVFMVFPSQKYLQDGRGYEAAYLAGLGALVGVVLACGLILVAMDFLTRLVDLLADHSLWIIVTAMAFVWLSEWPKDPARQKKRIGRLAAAWVQLLMGLVTIAAAGILGIYLFFSQLVPADRAFQGLAAAFVGLFAFPSLLQNLVASRRDVPPQHQGKSVEITGAEVVQGIGAGAIGGAIGMLVPSLTAGVGNSFARHAVAQSGDRSFMFSQGLSRSVYYLGAVLLLFIPGVTIRRGGAALFITLFYVPETTGELLAIVATTLVAAAAGWATFHALVRAVNRSAHKINNRLVALLGAAVMLALTYWMLGLPGLFVLAVATAIGEIPLVFNTRRIHCIAVIVVPIALSMAGLTPAVSAAFGLG